MTLIKEQIAIEEESLGLAIKNFRKSLVSKELRQTDVVQ